MKVIWKEGFRAKVPAQVAYDVISGLQQEGKGEASDLVDASRPEDAPLHSMFEWNDAVAAELYRVDQARCIIRHVCVIQEDENEKSVPVRAFFQIDSVSGSYEPTVLIMNDDEKRKRLLEVAKGELNSFKQKYKTLTELSKVFAAIDELNE